MICPMCMEEHEPIIIWREDKFQDINYDFEFTFCKTAEEAYLTEEQIERNYYRWLKAKEGKEQ